jgi:hypothetical protein
MSQAPIATLCAEYQFHLEEIIDSMRRVYEKKHTNLKARGRDDKSAHRIAMKTAQQRLKLDMDELDNKFADVRPQMEEYIREQQEKQLTMKMD